MTYTPPIAQDGQYWPGSNVPISQGNGFTLGYLGTPWWQSSGARAPKVPAVKTKGGFGANNGTIPGMREQ